MRFDVHFRRVWEVTARRPRLFGDLGRDGGVGRDLAIAVLAAVSILAVTSRIGASAGDRPLDPLAYASMVVAGGALGLRRWPVATVALVTGALGVYLARGYPGGPVFVTLFVALYW